MTNILKEFLKILIRNKVNFFTLVLLMSFFCYQNNSYALMTPESMAKCPVNSNKNRSQLGNNKDLLSCMQSTSQKDCGFNLLPIHNMQSYNTKISSTPGARWGRTHFGTDIAFGMGGGGTINNKCPPAKQGPAIVAARDAYQVNVFDSRVKNSAGLYVVLYHKYDEDPNDAKKLPQEKPIAKSGSQKCFCTVYMHLYDKTVRDKQGSVAKDAQIGYAGGSGRCKAGYFEHDIHLHIELKTCDNLMNCMGGTSKKIDPLCDGLCGDNKSLVEDCEICKKTPSAAVCKETPMNFVPNSTVGTHNNINVEPVYSEISTSGSEDAGQCKIENYRNTFTGCLFCKLFENIFNTASIISGHAFKIIAPSIVLLVLIGTAIWISFALLKNLSAFEVKDPRRMLKEIINKLFVVLIVVVLLKSDPYIIFSLTIEPIFNTGAKLAQLIAGTTSCNTSDFKIIEMGLAADSSATGGLPQSMGLSILCTVRAVQDQILDVMSLGSTMLCLGFFKYAWLKIPLFPHFGYAISGLVLWIGAILLMVIYPWLLIDTVLKLAVVVALTPAAVGGFAFKSTKKYIGVIWNSFMSTIFNFIFLTIIIFIITTMIGIIVSTALSDIQKLNNLSPVDAFLGSFGVWGKEFLQLAFVIILGWAVLSEGSELSGKFSDVWGSGAAKFSQNIGSNVGTTVMSGVKGAASPVAEGAASLSKSAVKTAGSGLKSAKNRVFFNIAAKNIEKKSGGNVDANGNATYSYKNWRGKSVTKTLSKDAYGNQKITQTKTSKKKTVTTERDKFMTMKTLTDNKTGKVIGQETNMNTAFMKSLLNSNGSINQIAINSFMKNSMHDQEAMAVGLMNQINKERFGDSAKISSTFDSRNITIGQNENGGLEFSLNQTLGDGTKQVFSMSLSDKRAKTSLETISKNGKSFSMESDGIINKTRERRYDANGEIIKKYESTRYSISSYYDKISGRGLNSLGDFGNHIPKDEIMFSDSDIAAFTSQVANYGDPEVDSSFLR